MLTLNLFQEVQHLIKSIITFRGRRVLKGEGVSPLPLKDTGLLTCGVAEKDKFLNAPLISTRILPVICRFLIFFHFFLDIQIKDDIFNRLFRNEL